MIAEVEAKARRSICSRSKAITTLIPFAVLQERDGKRQMLDVLLHAVRAAKSVEFLWKHIFPLTPALLTGASRRTIVLVSPHLPWDEVTDGENLVKRWAGAVSTVLPGMRLTSA
jgi:hypothetical protein